MYISILNFKVFLEQALMENRNKAKIYEFLSGALYY